jgi:hypothetical protein
MVRFSVAYRSSWIVCGVVAAFLALSVPPGHALAKDAAESGPAATVPDATFGADGTRTTTAEPGSKLRREAITDGRGHTVEKRVYEADGSIAYGFFDPGNKGKLAFEMFLAPQFDVTTSYTSEVLPVYHQVPTGKWNLIVTFHNGIHDDVRLIGKTRAEADEAVKKWEKNFAGEIAR